MGDNIILGIDMNDNVQSSVLSFKLKNLELKDTVLSLHPFVSPPDTSIGTRIENLLMQFGFTKMRKPLKQDAYLLIMILLLHHQMDTAYYGLR